MDQRIPTPPATADEWIALPDHAADGALWRLVCSWAGGMDTFLDDVDWSLPLRFFLQARAGRAVRRVRDPSRYVLEQALIAGSPELDIAEQSARIGKPPGIDLGIPTGVSNLDAPLSTVSWTTIRSGLT